MESKSFCQHCGAYSSKTVIIKQCNRCKRASYCSRKCQKDDWPFHKDFCEAANSISTEISIYKTYTAQLIKNKKFTDFLSALGHLLAIDQYLCCKVQALKEETHMLPNLKCSISAETVLSKQKSIYLTPGHRDYAFQYQLADGRVLNDFGAEMSETCALNYRAYATTRAKLVALPIVIIASGDGSNSCFVVKEEDIVTL